MATRMAIVSGSGVAGCSSPSKMMTLWKGYGCISQNLGVKTAAPLGRN